LFKFTKRFAHRLKSSDISKVMILFRQIWNYTINGSGTFHGCINDEFVKDFRKHILKNKIPSEVYKRIENIRHSQYSNYEIIDGADFGAGTRAGNKKRTIAGFAKNAVISGRQGKILFKMVNHYQPDLVVELGTGLGIGTLYMALGNPQAKLITIEGNKKLASVAANIFTGEGINTIKLINGKFDEVLTGIINSVSSKTMVFIDGNHTFDATLRYYKTFAEKTRFNGIIIIDDINWSREMMDAWQVIKKSGDSLIYIDLFYFGIVFINRWQY